MQITQDVRDYAARHATNESTALAAGLMEKADEFRAAGGEIYLPTPADEPASVS